MPEQHEFQNDEFDKLLQINREESGSNDPLRQAILAQTLGIIRFRRRLKKCTLAASLVACYLAGVATMGWRPTVPTTTPGLSNEQAADRTPARHRDAPPPAIAEEQPKQQPAAPPLSREEMLRREGDQLLADGDMKKAIRKYELALDLASADQRAISPQHDTWLLMALKNARPKEITHDRAQP
jgi:hypothetical protein